MEVASHLPCCVMRHYVVPLIWLQPFRKVISNDHLLILAAVNCIVLAAANGRVLLLLPLVVSVVSVGGLVAYGVKGAKDSKLPIINGPQTSGENGKGGSVRNRL